MPPPPPPLPQASRRAGLRAPSPRSAASASCGPGRRSRARARSSSALRFCLRGEAGHRKQRGRARSPGSPTPSTQVGPSRATYSHHLLSFWVPDKVPGTAEEAEGTARAKVCPVLPHP